jgi:hypothetical protein
MFIFDAAISMGQSHDLIPYRLPLACEMSEAVFSLQ